VAPYDPELPIRGRYVELRLKVAARGFPGLASDFGSYARLSVEGDQLVATPGDPDSGEALSLGEGSEAHSAWLETPVAYFIPEHVEDPSSTPGLVVEVTVPRRGPPRPIRLGVRKGDAIEPLDL
jgi:hypothetical protein